MMKQKILLVAALALAGAAIPFEKIDIRGISAADAAFGEDCAENFVSFFSDAYAMECKIDSSAFALMGMNYSYTIKEEVSSIARSSDISVTLANESMQIGYDYVVADAEGDAYRRSLKVDNSTVDTAIVDSNSEKISFLDNYGSFFSPLDSLAPSAFASFFTASADGTGFTVTPTSRGLASISKGLDRFLFDITGYNYDSQSHVVRYDDLHFKTDAAGNPTELSFKKVEMDRYGGVAEYYTVKLSALENGVAAYPAAVSSMEAEEKNALQSSFDLLASKIADGNFTSHISFSSPTYDIATVNYDNYYDLSGIGLMLSGMIFQDSSNGDTLTGLYNGGSYYAPIGFSPKTDTFQILSTDLVFETISSVLPLIGSLSVEFFDYADGVYSFAPSSKSYYGGTFGNDLLAASLGIGDYYSYWYSGSLYIASSSSLSISIDEMSVTIDETTGLPTFSYTYTSEALYGEQATTTVSFDSFGTTDLNAIASGDSDLALLMKDALELYDEYDRVPTVG